MLFGDFLMIDKFYQIFTDENYILHIMRSCKFDIEKSVKRFEQYNLLKCKYFQDYFDLRPNSIEEAKQMIDDHVVYPLRSKDHEGRSVIIFSFGKRNTERFSSAEMIRLWIIIVSAMLDEEILQLAGVICILDGTGATWDHTFSINDLKFLSQLAQKAASLRVKKVLFWNIPAIAHFSLKAAHKIFSKKISLSI